jgi:hypothetical protein
MFLIKFRHADSPQPPPCPLCGHPLHPVRVVPASERGDRPACHDASVVEIAGADWYCERHGNVKYFIDKSRLTKSAGSTGFSEVA